MDFWLTDDQESLRDGIRSFVEGRFDLDTIAEREESDAVLDPDGWRELAAMGVFTLRQDGFDLRDSVVAYEELGRGLVPGPLVTTYLASGLIDGVAEGDAIVGHWQPGPSNTVVEHLGQLTDALWLRDDGITRIDLASVSATPAERPLDPLAPVSISTDEPVGELIGDDAAAQDATLVGTLLTAALQVGVAAAAVERSSAYAKEREQFGRPIGSFQAVKHLLAEMLTKAEIARAAVHAAACAVDGAADDDPNRAVSVAKVMAGDAAIFCGRTGIQVHGGMGYTWEVHIQRYWKRAVVLENCFGTSDHHADRVADAVSATRNAN